MIVSHRAPSSLNMSPYPAIWIHFRPIFMIFIDLILQTGKSCWHLGQAQLGPSLAQARFLEIWKSGDLEIQKFEIQNIKKLKIIKIQIRSTQNVSKVWISRKQILLARFHAISDHFFHGPKNPNNVQNLRNFLGGPMGLIHPVWANGAKSCEH